MSSEVQTVRGNANTVRDTSSQSEVLYGLLKEHLRKACEKFGLTFEPLKDSSYRLQRFMINNHDCKVLLSQTTHQPKGTAQTYAYFKVPTLDGPDRPEFLVLLIPDGATYVVPTEKVVESGLTRISIPIPPLSSHAGARNQPKIGWEIYKNAKGAELITKKEK